MRLSGSLDRLYAAVAEAGLPPARKQYSAEDLASLEDVFGRTQIVASL